jgi:hypothetical protein
MNTDLIQILSKKMTNAERLSQAKDGLALVAGSEKQIDAITPKLDALDVATDKLIGSSGLILSVLTNGLPDKIIFLAQKRHAAINDIRAYSYRADFDTRKIFQHIVDEDGALPDSYVIELNAVIPAKEQEFNNRTNRYNDLQEINKEIESAFAAYEERFLSKLPPSRL